ncbi:Uncharacterized protein PECH_005116 [Penicillium ucsense]|uniref:NOTCH1 EGF-like calcium-binding domain-containing protein n=1 Tax=Penicillium ucsense TaxID=2839758 RepID=A0A8J8W322_9EURO|nr:Uncharacterized protein PECM_005907 [Penicillium ucsense]KAF7736609.1 Uncharacterized protein PECH_005116 [Penicillium ucsense]
MYLTSLAILLAVASSALASPYPTCGTCNPLSGQNSCDVTTSCINTGTTFHCACRAGYKASRADNDITSQYRLNMPNYEFLVFVPENTVCETPCDDPYAAPSELCCEVAQYDGCAV